MQILKRHFGANGKKKCTAKYMKEEKKKEKIFFVVLFLFFFDLLCVKHN